MTDRDKLGRRGEKLAVRHLRRKGHKTVKRNYSCPIGEVDIITMSSQELVFVEVKTRVTRDVVPPEANVTPAKQRRIRRIAEYYLTEKRIDDFGVRFDVVSIVLPESGKPTIEHFENAF